MVFGCPSRVGTVCRATRSPLDGTHSVAVCDVSVDSASDRYDANSAANTFIREQLDRVALAHSTFTQEALQLVVSASEGLLRHARNLERGPRGAQVDGAG